MNHLIARLKIKRSDEFMAFKTKSKIIGIILAAGLIILTLGFIAQSAMTKYLYPIRYEQYVEKYSQEYNVPENLIYAVIRTESSFKSDAVSNVGAVGLTQIMPDAFEWINNKLGEDKAFESLYNEETSIRYGAFLLGYLLDEFENPEAALAAYHAGRGNVNKWLNDKAYSKDGIHLDTIPISDTAHYVRKVMRSVNIYNKLNPISDGKDDK